MRPTLALLVAVLAAPVARADGCKFASDGRTVPEREQRALVEWADGTETLYVAARTDPSALGSAWVVPVRAAGAAVAAEPVEDFPAVVYFTPVRKLAERRLRDVLNLTAVLDSGGLCCPFALGGCGGGSSAAVEESRVERHGMVVTVVSAAARGDLAAYLARQGVNAAAVDLSSLESYFGRPGYSFVCGWVAAGDRPVTATGLKVVFPSPNLWFPLLPTRAQTDPVETVVYARGFVRPADGCELPGLKCEPVVGYVEGRRVGQVFGDDRKYPYGYNGPAPREELTRVTLTADPRQWDRDLELVPGTSPGGSVALVVTEGAGRYWMLWSALLGAVLGLAVPPVTVRRGELRRVDWLAGALIGASIVGSVWTVAVAFSTWRVLRFPLKASSPAHWLVVPVLAAAHLGLVSVVCYTLIDYVVAG